MNNQTNQMNNQEKRKRVEYNIEERVLMDLKNSIVINHVKILDLTKKSVIFDNQELVASQVISSFKNRKKLNILCIGRTQQGKTGIMLALIRNLLEDTNNPIPIENIYIITALSSKEWINQTKERMPCFIKVYHRSELPMTFVGEIANKNNVCIIMDEIQVAAQKGQTIYKTFNNAGLLNKSNLYQRDIKICEFTATPDGTIYDLMEWGNASSKILAEPGDGYISSYDLLQQGRIKQSRDLCGYDKNTKEVDKKVIENIQEIKRDIESFRNNPLYHIIRTPNGLNQDITVQNFKQVFNDSYDFINYDRESEYDDINKILINRPRVHTFVFIKEMCRCAKTLHKSHIGILYDRHTKCPDDAVVIQGLIGRLTGYDDNGISICYTNINSIIKYEQLWNSAFEDKSVNWNSKTTKFLNGTLLVKNNTFNNPKYYGFSQDNEQIIKDIVEPVVIQFSSQDLVKEFYNKHLKSTRGRGPNKRKANIDGWYESIIRGVKKVRSYDEIMVEKRHGLNKSNYRLYPSYLNTNDQSTLQWLLVYYE